MEPGRTHDRVRVHRLIERERDLLRRAGDDRDAGQIRSCRQSTRTVLAARTRQSDRIRAVADTPGSADGALADLRVAVRSDVPCRERRVHAVTTGACRGRGHERVTAIATDDEATDVRNARDGLVKAELSRGRAGQRRAAQIRARGRGQRVGAGQRRLCDTRPRQRNSRGNKANGETHRRAPKSERHGNVSPFIGCKPRLPYSPASPLHRGSRHIPYSGIRITKTAESTKSCAYARRQRGVGGRG